MLEDDDLEQMMEEILDYWCELPDDEIRQLFDWNRIPQSVDFAWKLGGTEYTIVSHFNKNANECLREKVDRLLEREIHE